MSLNLAPIRKSLAAGGGALLTGVAGALQADNWNFHMLTSQQLFPVLTFAISAGVAAFAIPNKYAPVVAEVEQVAAQAGSVVLAKAAQPLAAALDSLDASLAAMQETMNAAAAQGVPVVAPVDPVAVGAHAAI